MREERMKEKTEERRKSEEKRKADIMNERKKEANEGMKE